MYPPQGLPGAPSARCPAYLQMVRNATCDGKSALAGQFVAVELRVWSRGPNSEQHTEVCLIIYIPRRVRHQLADVEAGSLTRRQASMRCGCTGTAIAYQAHGQGQQLLRIAIPLAYPRWLRRIPQNIAPKSPSPNEASVSRPRIMRPGDALATQWPRSAAA